MNVSDVAAMGAKPLGSLFSPGRTERPLTRSGAKPGDLVCATGDVIV